MKKFIFSLVGNNQHFCSRNHWHKNRRQYSIAVNTITEYLENKFTTFDEAYADNVVFDLNGNKANKAAVNKADSTSQYL